MAAVGSYTGVRRCMYVFGEKFGDIYGSEGVVVQGADWHSDAG